MQIMDQNIPIYPTREAVKDFGNLNSKFNSFLHFTWKFKPLIKHYFVKSSLRQRQDQITLICFDGRVFNHNNS